MPMSRVKSAVGKLTPTNLITSHLEERDPELRRVTSCNTLNNRSEFSPGEYTSWLKGPVFVKIDESKDVKEKNKEVKERKDRREPLRLDLVDSDSDSNSGYEVSPESLTELDYMLLKYANVKGNGKGSPVVPPESSRSVTVPSVTQSSDGSEPSTTSPRLGTSPPAGVLRRSGSFNITKLDKKKVAISPMIEVVSFKRKTPVMASSAPVSAELSF
mmetsp:Transcript_28407/g.111447  ORF Transcript_28407/g.111447 Transcript_28407/m.111447 type:complete len:215 (-) Transcript_28407:118-762(-)|eukprot:CAMPEP_0113969606 /NCGR_PEP_ID=MMETSP0011_2-20120614/10458_1 /TAXON_ID=101924 /ORGANISM="Rhodosorus marinus" /LENGTH=214 /DNA_ID=CAMNT_0000983377 /DNA_START=55 /DNA_END=699 /DNA_ORIENTATION=+ /assembly_acc=CAM_ASM_000156